MLDAFIHKAKRFGITDLPGLNAQLELASLSFDASKIRPNKDSKKAGVLAVILMNQKASPRLLYIKRSTQENDKHSGQISFPGGQFEAKDKTLLDCALRETKEEVGIDSLHLQILGALTQMYVHVSDFIIQPYLAICESVPTYILEEKEVATIIEYPISELLEKQAVKYKDMTLRNHLLKQVPYFDLHGEILWGATAMITNEILHLIRSPHKL